MDGGRRTAGDGRWAAVTQSDRGTCRAVDRTQSGRTQTLTHPLPRRPGSAALRCRACLLEFAESPRPAEVKVFAEDVSLVSCRVQLSLLMGSGLA